MDPTSSPTSWSASDWSDATMGHSLRLAAESMCVFGGFLAASINVVRGDHLVTVAVAGIERAITPSGEILEVDEILGRTIPVSVLEELVLAQADDWGVLKYVPHTRSGLEQVGWRVDMPYDGSEWHPDDMLLVPVRDDDGRLRGLMALDGPTDGLIPTPERRPLLQQYAAQAARVLLTAIERSDLNERVRLAEAAREVLGRAAQSKSPEAALRDIADDLLCAFGLTALRGTVFESTDRHLLLDAGTSSGLQHSPALTRIGRIAAERLWRQQQVAVLGRTQTVNSDGTDADRALVRAYIEESGLESILIAPLGAGDQCLGALAMYRGAGAPPWTEIECSVAQEIGRDLGRILSISRALGLARQATEELREVDAYKSRLIATVAHELKNPIAAVRANLDEATQLTSPAGVASDAGLRRSLAAMDRGVHRLSTLVEELLLLASTADPNAYPVEPIEVIALVETAVGHALEGAGAGRSRVRLELPEEPVPVIGNAHGIEIVVVNLVSNALKYSPADSPVTVRLRHGEPHEVELSVIDEGIGISEADQAELFTEFFRSTNPAALEQPGTGLGLTIVDRIVRRHRGRVTVESELGRGSAFRVLLPAG